MNALDNRGRAPLHYACRSVDEGAIALLLAHGADISIRSHPLPWGELQSYETGSPYHEFILNKEKSRGDEVKSLASPTSGLTGSSPLKSSPNSPLSTSSSSSSFSTSSLGKLSTPNSPTMSNKKKKSKSSLAVMENKTYEFRPGGKHRRVGNDFGTIQGQGCGVCLLAAQPEDRNDVYELLASGCEEQEMRAMHASLLSRYIPCLLLYIHHMHSLQYIYHML